jgi:hypothetical protein
MMLMKMYCVNLSEPQHTKITNFIMLDCISFALSFSFRLSVFLNILHHHHSFMRFITKNSHFLLNHLHHFPAFPLPQALLHLLLLNLMQPVSFSISSERSKGTKNN